MKSADRKFQLGHSQIESKTVLRYIAYEESIDDFVSELSSKKKDIQKKVIQSFQNEIQMDSVRLIVLSQILLLLSASLATIVISACSGLPIDINSLRWYELEEIQSNFITYDVIKGFLGAVPLILAGTLVAKGENRDFAVADFISKDMVITLFGRRRDTIQKDDVLITNHQTLRPTTPTIHAFTLSFIIAMIAGTCEEIVFRDLVPSAIYQYSNSLEITLLSQAALFGMVHISPKISHAENKVFSTSQAVVGLWYGVVYLQAGGNILPCIIAHALNDSHMFMKNWKEINDQMDYTENAVFKELTAADQDDLRVIKEEVGPKLSTETFAFLRRFFYAFDYDRIGCLSRPDVQKAIYYAFLNDDEKPNEKRVNNLFTKLVSIRDETKQNNSIHRLELAEFIRLVLHLRANPKIV